MSRAQLSGRVSRAVNFVWGIWNWVKAWCVFESLSRILWRLSRLASAALRTGLDGLAPRDKATPLRPHGVPGPGSGPVVLAPTPWPPLILRFAKPTPLETDSQKPQKQAGTYQLCDPDQIFTRSTRSV